MTPTGTRLARTLPHTTGAGVALAFGAAMISGVAVWLNASAVRQVADAALYTTLKNAVAAAILLTILLATTRGHAPARLGRHEWGRLLLIGLIGGSVPFLLFFSGLAQATAPGAAFIQKTLFVWVALLAVPFLGERLGWAQVLAIAVLLGGQVLVAPPRLDGAGWSVGESMILAATLLWAVEVILVKRLLAALPVIVVATARLGMGVLFLVGWLVLSGSIAGLASVTATGWAWVLITGVVLAAYVLTWFAALERAPATLVSCVLVVGAVVTSILGAISAGAVPPTGSVVGAAGLLLAASGLAFLAVRRVRATVPSET